MAYSRYCTSNGCFLDFIHTSLRKAVLRLQNRSCHHQMPHLVKSCAYIRGFFSTAVQTDVSFILPTNRYLSLYFVLQNQLCHQAAFREIVRMKGFFSTTAQTNVSFSLPTNRYVRLYFAWKICHVIKLDFVKSCT